MTITVHKIVVSRKTNRKFGYDYWYLQRNRSDSYGWAK